MPVFFECKDGEALGLSLEVSIDGPGHILRVANDLAPLGQKTTTHIRIAVSTLFFEVTCKIQIRSPLTLVAWL
jgi:hypothetical protein